jgi:Leucine-rich repeat (LRR) protein
MLGEYEDKETMEVLIEKTGNMPRETIYDEASKLLKLTLLGQGSPEFLSEIGRFIHLRELYLYGVKLSSLPSEAWQLPNLQTLIVCDLEQDDLLAEIGQCKSLRHLGLGMNQLPHLPREIWELTDLQTLDLSWNKLSNLPGKIGKLTNLRWLYLAQNQLSRLPDEIGQLANLQLLDLSRNQISLLPPEIGQLASLKRLDINRNQVSSLPDEIGQLTGLLELGLAWNQLHSLPAEITQLTSLQILSVYENPALHVLPEIELLTRAKNGKFSCRCCGFLTLDERDSWEICSVCFWEDDPFQSSYPSSITGANRTSLIEARNNFARIGAMEERLKQYVRPPNADEMPENRM